MSTTQTQIQQAMNEARILILGTEVLLGFQLRSVFEPGFESLPASSQAVKLAGLALLVVTFALLVMPSAWHQLAADGDDPPHVKVATTFMVGASLLPFGMVLAMDVYVAARPVLGGVVQAIAASSAVFVLAMSAWYGAELLARTRKVPERRQDMPGDSHEKSSPQEKLSKKIDHVLTEARMVLPGSQALLGFQLATVMQQSFERLPSSLRLLHLASLALVTVSTILLMMPAAWHRLVERGEETERFPRFARWPLVIAMGFLALGICGDLWVVVEKVTGSGTLAHAFAGLALAVFAGLWYIIPAVARTRLLLPRSLTGMARASR